MRAHICVEGTVHCCVLMCMRVCRIFEYWNAQLKVLFFIFISAPVIYITKSHQNWHSFRNTKLLIVFCKRTIPLATNMILHFEMSFTFWITARESPFTNISSRQAEATDMGPESRFYLSLFSVLLSQKPQSFLHFEPCCQLCWGLRQRYVSGSLWCCL